MAKISAATPCTRVMLSLRATASARTLKPIKIAFDANAKLAHYTKHWESPEKGIENLLRHYIPEVTEVRPVAA